MSDAEGDERRGAELQKIAKCLGIEIKADDDSQVEQQRQELRKVLKDLGGTDAHSIGH